MTKKLVVSLISFVLFFSFAFPVEAKLLPRAKPTTTKTGGTVTNSSRVSTKVKLRGDRRALIATFTNLSVATSISYSLTYDAGGITQGVGGTVDPSLPEPVVRELLFGSCSAGTCRYDSGIKNAKLVVTSNLKSGKKVVKTFRVNPRI